MAKMFWTLVTVMTLDLCVAAVTVQQQSDLAQVNQTLTLLGSGDANIVLDSRRDVVLVMGVTGAGKSTLTQFIATPGALVAKRKHGVYLIEDGNRRIGNSTLTSRTFFPELVLDPGTGTAFYDCPGFSDTRSANHDIAASYFIKRVLDHANRVKMMFTVAHSAVEVGNDREGFLKLLCHICALVSDVDRYSEGFLLVVTKVRNELDIDDTTVIGHIAGFMTEAREDLTERINSDDLDPENSSFYSCAVKLIDVFLLKAGETYARIGIFRRPNKAGPLSESLLLAEGKQNIERILAERTNYTTRNVGDFNYAISDGTKYYITNILNRIVNVEIVASLVRLADLIESEVISKCDHSMDMYKLQSQLDAVDTSLADLTTVNSTFTPKEFIAKIETSTKTIGVNAEDILVNVTRQMEYLEVFHTFSKSKGEYFSTAQGAQKFFRTGVFVRNLNNWYVLLLDLYDKHSRYRESQKKTYYNVSDLIGPSKEEKVTFNLDQSNVNTFLEVVTNSSVGILAEERAVSIALRDLNSVMTLAYRSYVDSWETSMDSSLDRLAKEMKREYLNKCRQLTDMPELHKALRAASESLQRLTQTSFTTATAFKIGLTDALQATGLDGNSTLMHIDHMLAHRRSYDKFTNSSDDSEPRALSSWSSALKPAADYLADLDGWYQHILSVHSELTNRSLAVMSHTERTNLSHWIVDPGRSVDVNNMRAFLSRTKSPGVDRLLGDNDTLQIVLRDLNDIALVATTLAAKCEALITRDLNTINTAIQTTFKLQCVKSHDMNSLQESLRVGYNAMRRLTETNLTDEGEFIDKLLPNTVQDVYTPVNRAMFSRISKRIQHLQYLREYFNSKTDHFDANIWAGLFLPGKDYVFGLSNWYTLLLHLHRKLSEYPFQRDTTKYNVQDINKWGVENQTQGIHLDEHNVGTFLQKVENLKLEGFKWINSSSVEDVVLRDLNRILYLTLIDNAKENAEDGVLTIQGQYVVISRCRELLSRRTEYKSVRVFALNTVFIDADIEITAELAIIAPTWDIQGGRKIVLTGKPGLPPPKAEKAGLVSFFDESFSMGPGHVFKAGRGTAGVPGKPGLPGGSFFGVGHTFLRGHSLTVSSRGGAGGRGQDGGAGGDGLRQLELDREIAKADVLSLSVGSPAPNNIEVNSCTYYVFVWVCYLKVLPTSPVSRGGDGGVAGVGGKGGLGGEVSIIHLGRKSGIKIVTLPGSQGIMGQPGAAGKGGYKAKPLVYYRRTSHFDKVAWLSKELDGEELPDGKPGKAFLNRNGTLPPVPARKLPKSEFINTFKRYSWSNLKSVATYSPLSMFLETLRRNADLNSIYDTSSYVQELNYLDVASHATDDLTVYYKRVIESVLSYLKSSSQITPEERRVLQFVYTAGLSRVCRLRARADRNLITDLGMFLEQAKANLDKFADLKTYQEIDKLNVDYKNTIEHKIKEANNFINSHTSVEIDEVAGEIEMNIRALESETKALQEKAKNHKNAVKEYERKLLSQTITRSLFSILRVGSIAFTPAVQAAVAVGASIADTVISLNPLTDPGTWTSPPGLINSIHDMEIYSAHNAKQRNLIKFVRLTDAIVGEIGADYSQLNRLKSDVVAIKANVTASSLTTARDDLDRALELAALGLQPGDVKGKQKLDTITTLASKSRSSLDILAKYKKSLGSRGSAAVKAAEKAILDLEAYEQQIHETFVPLFKNMHQSLRGVESKLANQSHAYLDVGRWQVQKCIRNVKHLMQQATRGFHAGDKLQRTISKLEEVSDLIINLYDRIETYQDQKRLGDLISGINKAAHVDSVVVSDPQLKSAVTRLEMTIISNTIITQYTRALNSFKQQVFPFASSYPHLLNEELSSDGNANISVLVSRARTKLQLMISAVSESQSTIQNGRDLNVFTADFSSDHRTSRPFFTWGNEAFNEEIASLLSGEEVVLKAELTLGPREQNAVKFSLVRLSVRVTEEGWQGELDEALSHFDVELKHFGSSHYRCGDRFYVISGESQTLVYSFENHSVNPVRSNLVYNKMRDGDLSLSPYAMWSMKLVSTTSGFGTLSRFKGKVNLELVGKGKYVKANVTVCQQPLDLYYDVYTD